MGKINGSWYTSNNDKWATPQFFFDKLNKTFKFTLDPCALPSSAKCENYYTPEDDGLSQNWGGNIVFMNPPYSEVKTWLEKAYEESKKPNTTVVSLVPSRTDTRWWHDYAMKGEIIFVKGRLKFGDSKNSAPFPSAVVVMGDRAQGGRFGVISNKEEENG